MFVNYTQFRGIYYIAGLNTNLYCDAVNSLNQYIDIYEDEYLECIFGYELTKSIKDGLTTPTIRTDNLINGLEYIDNSGRLQNIAGLKNDNSPLLGYVYFFYQRYLNTQTSVVGERVTDIENSTNVSPYIKCMNAWNEMVKETNKIRKYLSQNRNIYPEWQSCKCKLEPLYL